MNQGIRINLHENYLGLKKIYELILPVIIKAFSEKINGSKNLKINQ